MPVLYNTTGISRKSAYEYVAAMQQYTIKMNKFISESNIEPIAPIIYDSVDVTTSAGWGAKWHLHKIASRLNIKTIGAYDIGNRSQVFYFPYDKPNQPILNGKVNQEDMDTLTPQGLNIKLLPKILGPIPNVPLSYAYQYFARARKIYGLRTSLKQGQLTREEIDIPGVPQERIASSLYEAAVAELTWRILEGDGENIPELMEVETTPDGLFEKMKLVLLFVANRKLIGETAAFEKSLE